MRLGELWAASLFFVLFFFVRVRNDGADFSPPFWSHVVIIHSDFPKRVPSKLESRRVRS